MSSKRLLFIILILAVILSLSLALTACNTEELSVVFMISDSDVYTTVSVNKGSALGGLPSQPKRTGYDFSGWYFDNGSWTQPFGGDTKVVESVTVYAHWVKSQTQVTENCRVIFDSRGGSVVSDIIIKSGETLTLPAAPERPGFVFSGWYPNLEFTPGEQFTGGVIHTNMTLYAYWLPVADEAYYTATNGIITSVTSEGQKLTSVTLPSELNGVAVKGIANGLFKGNKNLTEVTFPDGYTSIGDEAFKDCTALKRVNFVDSISSIGISAFENCSALTQIQLPASIDTVAERCFYGCSSVSRINFGFNSNVTSIGKLAFYNLNKLENIGIPNGVTSIGDEAYKYCFSATSLTFGDSIGTIGKQAFLGDSKLNAISLPNTVTSIGEGAFQGITNAKSITIGSGVTEIPANAFRGAKQCVELIIGNEVVSIGDNAFYGMEHIENVTLPGGLSSIGDSAFYGALRLKSVNLEDTAVTELSDHVFENTASLATINLSRISVIGASSFQASGLTEVDLSNISDGSDHTGLGARAFENCEKLTSVTFSDGIKKIPAYCFKGCIKLTEVGLQDIESIGTEAFANCVYIIKADTANDDNAQTTAYGGLTKVTFGDRLTEIDNRAFSNCRALTEISLPESLSYVGTDVFQNTLVLQSVETTGVNYRYSIGYVDDWAVAFSYSEVASETEEGETEKPAETVPDFTLQLQAGTVGIAYRLFTTNKDITAVEIPLSMRHLGKEVFAGCVNLKSVIFTGEATGGNMEIPESAFEGSVNLTSITLPQSVTIIGYSAFADCENLTAVTFSGNNLLSIGDDAFVGTKLASIALPASLETIGKNAFRALETLKTVSITGDSALSSIGDYAFAGAGITSVALPQSLVSIGEYAFAGTSDLESVTFVGEPANLTVIRTGAFTESGLTEFSVPKAVTNIELGAFEGAAALSRVTFTTDSLLTAIGDRAFRGTALDAITLPTGVKTIGNRAFENCSALTEVTVSGSALETIGEYAFTKCEALVKIYADGFTKESWIAVEKGRMWSHDTDPALVVECSDGAVDENDTPIEQQV